MKDKINSNRAQMEILGLSIVVILVLIATVFVVRFVVLKNPVEYRKGFVSAELASNVIDTFLKTTSQGCSQLTMTELLQDCFQGTSLICDNGEDTCTFFKSTANNIFVRTLEKWSYDYQFITYDYDVDSPKIVIGEKCKAEKKSKIFPVPSSTSVIYVRLDICG